MSKIRAVIFDMDGLLIDTEPIWRRAEIEVFGSVGLHLTEEQCLEMMGVRIAEIVHFWYDRQPWTGASRTEVTRRIQDYVIDHVLREGESKEGVYAALALVARRGLPVAIASSSPERMIQAVIERLEIARYVDVTCSADDEAEGKPHPAVYLSTARRLGVPARSCLALEDSPNGVISAKSAGMYCIVVPDPHLADDPRTDQADLRLSSLSEFSGETLRTIAGLPATRMQSVSLDSE